MNSKFLFVSFFIVILFSSNLFSQKMEQNPLIYHLRFVNETNHGMLIIHRLLEIYNQELNKHVDLENYALNNFGNDDFKENIFEDKSRAYYEIAPFTLYEKAIENEKLIHPSLATDLRMDITEIKNIAAQLESKRYSIAKLFSTADLDKMEGLKMVYSGLEDCVSLYKNFHEVRDRIQAKLNNYNNEKIKEKNLKSINNEVFVSFKSWTDIANTIILDLKNEQMSAVKANFPLLKTNASKLITAIGKNSKSPNFNILKEVEAKITKFNTELNAYINGGKASQNYNLYGDAYYYYNNKLTGICDKFGLGATFKFNEWLTNSDLPYVGFTEMPHFYKVIYPKKKDVKVEALAKTNFTVLPNQVIEMPKIVEKRKIVERNDKSIVIDSDTLYIEVYDNQEYDKDTISLNFNGTWVLKNRELTKTPIQLALPIIPDKDNFLVLHAENLGIKPPNTAAIKYYQQSKTKPQIVVLNSNLQESEAILIRKDSNNDGKKNK